MKQLFTLATLLLSIHFLPAQDLEAPETQLTLVTKITADWCPLCGGWGWTLFNGLIEDQADQDKAVFVAAHYSGGQSNATSSQWADNFGIIGQPEFYLNSQKQSANSGNVATTRISIGDKIDQTYGQSPVVQSGIRATFDPEENRLLVNTRTRFFQTAAGEFYLGIYLVEKTFIGYQSSQGNNAEHKFILRGSVTPGHFGVLIDESLAGQDQDHSYEMTIDDDYEYANLEVITVIWQKDGNTFKIINANLDEDIELETTAVVEALSGVDFRILSNPSAGAQRVNLSLDEDLPVAELILFDLLGRPVRTLHRGALMAGDQQFILERPATSGLYLLQLRSGDRVLTRKVVFD